MVLLHNVILETFILFRPKIIDGTTPPANVLNRLSQRDIFKTPDQQFAEAFENWALTLRKRRATLKRNATRKNQQLYFADPEVYNITRDPRFQ